MSYRMIQTARRLMYDKFSVLCNLAELNAKQEREDEMMRKTYILVIVDCPSEILRDIVTENIRIDFVRVGQVVHGRHWKGQRINVVVNRSRYKDFENTDNEQLAKWWAHVKQGLAKDAEIQGRTNE